MPAVCSPTFERTPTDARSAKKPSTKSLTKPTLFRTPSACLTQATPRAPSTFAPATASTTTAESRPPGTTTTSRSIPCASRPTTTLRAACTKSPSEPKTSGTSTNGLMSLLRGLGRRSSSTTAPRLNPSQSVRRTTFGRRVRANSARLSRTKSPTRACKPLWECALTCGRPAPSQTKRSPTLIRRWSTPCAPTTSTKLWASRGCAGRHACFPAWT